MAKILVVEDNSSLNAALKTILKEAGHKVAAAFDGEVGLDIAEEAEPDLVLLDLRMPVMGGLDFLRHYKRNEKHPDVKIIVFSATTNQDDIDRAFELGADHFMSKNKATTKKLMTLINETVAERSEHLI